jgi:hypothetical protein
MNCTLYNYHTEIQDVGTSVAITVAERGGNVRYWTKRGASLVELVLSDTRLLICIE